MKTIVNILLWIWQLPQNLLGLIFGLFMKSKELVEDTGYCKVYKASNMGGGISLGWRAYISRYGALDYDCIAHEGIGHAKQSRYLGPFYLIVIGLSSLIWAWLYGTVIEYTHNGYYKFWTERWADKLAGIIRK